MKTVKLPRPECVEAGSVLFRTQGRSVWAPFARMQRPDGLAITRSYFLEPCCGDSLCPKAGVEVIVDANLADTLVLSGAEIVDGTT